MVFITKVMRLAESMFNPVSHVIFDIDGLLLRRYIDEKALRNALKTEDIYYKIDKQVIEKYGKKYLWDVRLKVLGRTDVESAQIIVKECQLPITPEEYNAEVREIQNSLLKSAVFFPGAQRLVHHLAASKVPMAVATSSCMDNVGAKTSNHKSIFSLFHHIVTGDTDGLKQGKPAPDIYLLCASKFEDKPDPSKCLVFEDAPNGVKAAKAAGMQVVMVPEKYIANEDKTDATLVLNSLLDFDPNLFDLPRGTAK